MSLFPSLDGDADVVGDEVETLTQSDVTECAFFDLGGELAVIEADADLLLEGDAACGGILDAEALDGLDVLADGREEGGEGVDEEAGLTPVPRSAAVGLREVVEFFGEGDVPEPGVDEFLAGTDDCLALAEDVAEGGDAEAKV